MNTLDHCITSAFESLALDIIILCFTDFASPSKATITLAMYIIQMVYQA